MIELLALIALSWVIALILRSGSLVSMLGLNASKKILLVALLLFLITAVCCLSGYFFRTVLANEQFVSNGDLRLATFGKGLWETVRSVVFEELLCRGVLLYILIRKFGSGPAIIISATMFGLLHLLTIADWTNALQIALTFAFPFLLGLVLACAFARSGSIYVPFSIHLGWNIIQNFVFPDNPNVISVFVISDQPIVTVSYFAFFLIFAFPKIAAIVVNYVILKRMNWTMKSVNQFSNG
jgi:uncharacterized protein